jgi:hypothetical protein
MATGFNGDVNGGSAPISCHWDGIDSTGCDFADNLTLGAVFKSTEVDWTAHYCYFLKVIKMIMAWPRLQYVSLPESLACRFITCESW